ncbi:hypothetical protein F11_13255 [Rhodospirillum rubrum F11]|uniref:Uncharacterized protein n=1 Tax=Rhodospirillum rubrum (strain ATCC 11170 / ATH 1.1.1 / DSM 467 / LMG 4362 / NCIMB 8255 / S1) TaxID=269796 RepID=Q2RR67_RHORT|nr:hypothetical protein [Rhodospirillum rubrum]ABC23378.1 hypothetical protein Rru_A2581 [Rhodospirillum rubrum ATCC 11170]AEO49113.1 hypothetical protein F11_13255 [Rhodospirillum rubrum F11]MBK5955023.1 hypothetical protein [Rhodospirillum rubrum]QXG79351.1 hypothetical protein KUL73_13315 [Rhodospirillum rubrum]
MAPRLYFAWVAADEGFDPLVHARADEAILALEIRAVEGEAPRARVSVARGRRRLGGPQGQRHAVMSARLDGGAVVGLFRGVLAEVPDGAAGAFLTLLFDARTGDATARIAAALAPYKRAPGYDALFINEGREDEPEEILDGWFARLIVDRLDGAVGVSHGLWGGKSLSFGPGDIAEGSLDLRRPQRSPPAWVEGVVDARWLQRGGGTVDLGALIAREAGGPLVTLSRPEDFADGWPKPGAGLGGASGYKAVTSALVACELPAMEDSLGDEERVLLSDEGTTVVVGAGTGLAGGQGVGFGPTAARSSLFPMGAGAGWICFAKRAYWPVLTARWEIRQSRRQSLSCRLESHLAVDWPGAGEGERLSFGLRDVGAETQVPAADPAPCDCASLLALSRPKGGGPSAEIPPTGLSAGGAETAIGDPLHASFFHTPRGRRAVAHMLRVMAVRLAFAQRCVSLRARLPGWSARALAIDLDTTLSLVAATLPGGRASGKVVDYRFVWQGRGCWVEVEIACSVGGGGSMAPADPGRATYAEDYAEDFTLTTGGVVRGDEGDGLDVAIFDYAADQPTDRLAGAFAWGAADLVSGLCLRNLAGEQDAYLWTHRQGAISPKRLLFDVPTDVCLALRPLAADDQIHQTITVQAAGRFGLPPTIDLRDGGHG